MKKKLTYKAIVWREDEQYVALCLNVDISSCGSTKQEALQALKEALALYLETDDRADLLPVDNAEIVSQELLYA